MHLSVIENDFSSVSARYAMMCSFMIDVVNYRYLFLSQNLVMPSMICYIDEDGAIPIDIRAIVSNHTDFCDLAAAQIISPFHISGGRREQSSRKQPF